METNWFTYAIQHDREVADSIIRAAFSDLRPKPELLETQAPILEASAPPGFELHLPIDEPGDRAVFRGSGEEFLIVARFNGPAENRGLTLGAWYRIRCRRSSTDGIGGVETWSPAKPRTIQ